MIGYTVHEVPHCSCISAAERLVRCGYFPSTVAEPSIAFSFELLDFFRKIYEESSDATTAMAAALCRFLDERGFPFVNQRVSNRYTIGMFNTLT